MSKLLSVKISQTEVDGEVLSEKMKLPASSKNYIIFFTPRSGSSWLTDILSKTRELGSPEEWFNPHFTPAISKAIGVRLPLDYVKVLRRIRKTPNRVFGVEVTYFQYRTIDGFDLIDILDKPTTFYLRRKDLLKQGISLYRAVASDHYHNTSDISEEELQLIDAKAPYDAEKIRYWTEHILQQEIGFEALFAERGLAPLRLFYEDITGKEEQALRIFYERVLDRTAPDIDVPATSHKPISSGSNKVFYERFLNESADYMTQLDARRPSLVYG